MEECQTCNPKTLGLILGGCRARGCPSESTLVQIYLRLTPLPLQTPLPPLSTFMCMDTPQMCVHFKDPISVIKVGLTSGMVIQKYCIH